jgi:hypothetical protein
LLKNVIVVLLQTIAVSFASEMFFNRYELVGKKGRFLLSAAWNIGA